MAVGSTLRFSDIRRSVTG